MIRFLLARSHVPTERVEAINSVIPNIRSIFRWKEGTWIVQKYKNLFAARGHQRIYSIDRLLFDWDWDCSYEQCDGASCDAPYEFLRTIVQILACNLFFAIS